MQTLVAFGLAVLMSACGATTVPTPDAATGANASAATMREYSALLPSVAGCEYEYTVFDPVRRSSDALVVIGHGFLRSKETMRGLAQAIAATGLRTVALDYCNMKPWNGHHRRNADDMLALATHLQATEVILVGFSAGALAALLATATQVSATADSTPVILGTVLLDPVDQNDMGLNALSSIDTPVVALQGPASPCNAGAVAGPRYVDSARIELLDVPKASHCEFESPTSWLCQTFCGDEAPDDENDATRRAIIATTVSRVQALAISARVTSPDS